MRLNISFYLLRHVEYMIKQAKKRCNGAYKIIFPFTFDALKKKEDILKNEDGADCLLESSLSVYQMPTSQSSLWVRHFHGQKWVKLIV